MDNLFKENWFVFGDVAPENKAPVQSETPLADVLKDATGVNEEKKEAVVEATSTQLGQEKVKLETIKSLTSLKESMKSSTEDLKKLEDLVMSINLEREKITFDNFTVTKIREKIEEKIKLKTTPESSKAMLDKFFDLEGQDAQTLMMQIISIPLANKVKDALGDVDKWNLFIESKANMYFDITKGEAVKVYSSNEVEYKKFLEEQSKVQEEADKKVEDAKVQKSLDETEKEIQESINNHPFGPFILGFISGKPEDGSDSTLTKLAKGTSPVWGFLLGLIGVKKFEGSYTKAKEMASKNPKSKSIFDRLETAVKGFVPESKDEDSNTSEATTAYQSTTKESFDTLVKSSTARFPSKGIVLSELYSVSENKGVEVNNADIKLEVGKTLKYKKSISSPIITITANNGVAKSIKEDSLILVGDIPSKTIIKASSINSVTV